MPELPETETIARDVNQLVAGRRIEHATVRREDVLRLVSPNEFSSRLVGQTIQAAWRRAKIVVLDLSGGERVLVQPRFTGVLSVRSAGATSAPGAYDCTELALDDGRSVVYSDVRRLGTFTVATPAQFRDIDSALGVEPLDPEFTADRLSGILRGSVKMVKSLLMDQTRIAGCGNIYANEALWRAGVDPSRRALTLTHDDAGRLRDALVAVLRESIAARGTTFRDYRDASGGRGSFSAFLAAYGREGKPCQRCGSNLVGTHAIDGRVTVFCFRCQE